MILYLLVYLLYISSGLGGGRRKDFQKYSCKMARPLSCRVMIDSAFSRVAELELSILLALLDNKRKKGHFVAFRRCKVLTEAPGRRSGLHLMHGSVSCEVTPSEVNALSCL